MRKRNFTRLQRIIIVVACLLSIALAGTCVFMLTGVATYMQDAQDGAGIIGLIHSNEAAESFKTSINEYRDKSERFAQELLSHSFTDVEDFSLTIARMRKDYGIYFVRYFKDGVEYSLANQPFDMTTTLPKGSKTPVVMLTDMIDTSVYYFWGSE